MSFPIERPKRVTSVTHKVKVGCGNLYIIIGNDGGAIIEVFLRLGNAGSCQTGLLEALGRSVSIGLQHGVPIQRFIETLREIKCPSLNWDNGEQIWSCPDALAKVLKGEQR